MSKFKNIRTHGYIYALKCFETGKCYIGSTIQTPNIRHSKHKTDFIGHYGLKQGVVKRHYNTSFEILKHNNYQMIVLETYNYTECDTNRDKVKQLRFREQLYINKARNTGCDIVNGDKAYRCVDDSNINYDEINITPLASSSHKHSVVSLLNGP